MKIFNHRNFLWILPLAANLGAVLSSMQPGNWLMGWFGFSLLFVLSLSLLTLSTKWAADISEPSQKLTNPGRILAWMVALAFTLRFAGGVATYIVLPINGFSDEDDRAGFVYTDARSRQRHTCTLDALAFMDRFLQHVLPKGFCKVRYYGCFSPTQRTTLQAVRHWFAQTIEDAAAQPSVTAAPPPTVIRCPKCQQPMAVVATLRPAARCPPPAAGI